MGIVFGMTSARVSLVIGDVISLIRADDRVFLGLVFVGLVDGDHGDVIFSSRISLATDVVIVFMHVNDLVFGKLRVFGDVGLS